MMLLAKNVQIIVLSVRIYLNVKHVPLATITKSQLLVNKNLNFVHKYVEMELDFKLNVMMEILMIKMVAVVNALSKLVGLVREVLLLAKANVINLSQIKLSYQARARLI